MSILGVAASMAASVKCLSSASALFSLQQTLLTDRCQSWKACEEEPSLFSSKKVLKNMRGAFLNYSLCFKIYINEQFNK